MRATSANVLVMFSKVPFRKFPVTTRLKFLLNNYEVHQQQRFGRHSTVEDFTDIDQDTCKFFDQDFSKHHERKINEGGLKSITRQKIRPRTSKIIASKQTIFHLLLCASFSLKLTQLLNLIQYLLTYRIVFVKPYLHFYLLKFDILRIFDILPSSVSAPTLFYKTSKFFSLETFLLCFIFHETFLPINSENNS